MTSADEMTLARLAQLKEKWAKWPQGDAGDALDFALDHIDDSFGRTDFLECWREGRCEEWPEYVRWLKVQREGARAALSHRTGGERLP